MQTIGLSGWYCIRVIKSHPIEVAKPHCGYDCCRQCESENLSWCRFDWRVRGVVVRSVLVRRGRLCDARFFGEELLVPALRLIIEALARQQIAAERTTVLRCITLVNHDSRSPPRTAFHPEVAVKLFYLSPNRLNFLLDQQCVIFVKCAGALSGKGQTHSYFIRSLGERLD